jgi:hypothetical protein
MIFDVPIVAFKSSGIPYTLGKAGIRVETKNFLEIAALIKVISEDRALRRSILIGQRKRLADYEPGKLKADLALFLASVGVQIPKPPISVVGEHTSRPILQIEGPFETSYSLATVNRELAFALEKQNQGQVAVFATEGPGDYQPERPLSRSYPGLRNSGSGAKNGRWLILSYAISILLGFVTWMVRSISCILPGKSRVYLSSG